PHLVRTLPNKMTLVVRENRTRPLVAIQVWIKAGSRDEQLKERGVATVLARALFAATTSRDQKKIAEELNRYGGSSGSEAGAGDRRSCVVGDGDPEDVARRVEAAFQDAPKGKAPARARFAEKAMAAPQILAVTNPGDTEGAALTVGFRAPAWGTADALALDV